MFLEGHDDLGIGHHDTLAVCRSWRRGNFGGGDFTALDLPIIEPRPVQFLEREEAAALYAAAADIGPQWTAMMRLGTQAGLRLGELTGLHGHRVDWIRGRIAVIDVMTRSGLRQHPTSKRSPPRGASAPVTS